MGFTEGILAGLLVFQGVLFFVERKRLTNMIFSKTTGDLKYLEKEPMEKRERTSPMLEQRKRQKSEGER